MVAYTVRTCSSNGKSRRIVVRGGTRETKDHAVRRESCFRSALREEIGHFSKALKAHTQMHTVQGRNQTKIYSYNFPYLLCISTN